MKTSMILLITILAATDLAIADEVEEREQLRRESAAAYIASDFSKLEDLAALYRTGQAKTESGTWNLVWFHRGIFETAMPFDKSNNAKWTENLKKIDLWAKQFPDSPTPVIAYAGTLMHRAYMYRGTDYVSKVQEQDLKSYIDYLTLAMKHLTENAEKGSKDPNWYVLVAEILRAFGADKADFIAFMEEGIAHHPDFDQIYFATVGFLNPKWSGSEQEVATFAEKVRKESFANRGNELYARIYWAAGSGRDGRYLMQSPPANWQMILTSMDEILEKYPSQWNINHFAYFACYQTDVYSAKKYFNMIERPPIIEAWIGPANYKKCKEFLQQFKN